MDDLPFEISVVQSGGFAGLRRSWTIEVTAPADAERWLPIIEACPWDQDEAAGHPDGFVYAVQAAQHSAVVPESQLEGPWRELVDEVRRSADG